MIEKKCVVCNKLFKVQDGKSSGRCKKKGKQFNSRGNFSCSKKCARIYDALYHHFRYRLMKETSEKGSQTAEEKKK